MAEYSRLRHIAEDCGSRDRAWSVGVYKVLRGGPVTPFLYSDAINILSIIVILAIITGTVLAVIISIFFVSFVLYFGIITSATDIYCTYKVRDSNIEVDIYTI